MKQTRSLSEFSCLSESTQLDPNAEYVQHSIPACSLAGISIILRLSGKLYGPWSEGFIRYIRVQKEMELNTVSHFSYVPLIKCKISRKRNVIFLF